MRKCNLVSLTPSVPQDLDRDFPAALLYNPDGSNRVQLNGNFAILGSEIGDKAFCEQSLKTRVEKAKILLSELEQLDDPQVALRLQRACAGPCKLMHSMRTTPSHLISDQLSDFDAVMMKTLAKSTGLLLSKTAISQAQLGVKHAGLGLRSTAKHAVAAYTASLATCNKILESNGCSPVADFADPTSLAGESLAALNSCLPEASARTSETIKKDRQQMLSRLIDKAGFEALLRQAPVADQAQILSECCPGAYQFLHAIPNKHLNQAIDGAEFTCILAGRLCLKMLSQDEWCPLCDGVLDTKLRHPCSCPSGGERTTRHNKTRNIVFRHAAAACLQPEKEKADLLLPARPGDEDASLRRPADIYLPSAWNAEPIALDFAITCPTRQDILHQSSTRYLAASTDYAHHKRTYLDTENQCQRSGVMFLPMVAETTGAWSAEALGMLKMICKSRSHWSGTPENELMQGLLRELSVAIRSSNARATLRRVGELGNRRDQFA